MQPVMDWEVFAKAAQSLEEAIFLANQVDTASQDPDVEDMVASIRRLRGCQGRDVKASLIWIASKLRVSKRLTHA